MTLICNVPPSCHPAKPVLPIPHQPKQNHAEDATTKIKVNPTQLSDQMGRHVLQFVATKCYQAGRALWGPKLTRITFLLIRKNHLRTRTNQIISLKGPVHGWFWRFLFSLYSNARCTILRPKRKPEHGLDSKVAKNGRTFLCLPF